MTSPIKQLVLLLAVAACCQLVTLQSRRRPSEGEKCKLKNKEEGICRVLSGCPAAYKELQETQVWPVKCSTRGDGAAIVCCDERQPKPTTTEITPKPTTRSTTTTPNPTTRPTKINPKPNPVTSKLSLVDSRFQYSPPSLTPEEDVPGAGKISWEKCQQYSKWEDDPLLLPGSTGKMAGECANVAQFVIGGKEAEPLEFPHMAHLGYGELDNLQWGCGGSLISEQYVLTAGHCLQTKKDRTNVTYVRLGSSDPRSEEIVKIKELIPHPKYDQNQRYYDIALLKLEREIEFDNYKRPACLQVNRTFEPSNNRTLGIASGWGRTENGTDALKLMKVQLPILNNTECRFYYEARPQLSHSIDDRTQFCAGEFQKDTCQGDSGGPIQVSLKEPSCMYSILGVTSFGIQCGRYPGVFSRISGFIPWLEREVWGMK